MFSFRGKNKYGSKKGEDPDVVKNEIFTDVKTVKLPQVGIAMKFLIRTLYISLHFEQNYNFLMTLDRPGPKPVARFAGFS